MMLHSLLLSAPLAVAFSPLVTVAQDDPAPAGADSNPTPPSEPSAGPSDDEPPGFLSAAEFARVGAGVVVRKPGALDGVTLVSPLNSTSIHLVDLDGTIVHTWPTDSAPGNWCYLQNDGTLLRAARVDDEPKFRGGGIGGQLERLAPDGTVLWRHRIADEHTHQHHDLEPLPNGNLLSIQWVRIPKEDAVAAGRDPDHVGGAGLWPDVIQELRPTPPEGADVVWEWRAWDHLIQDFDPQRANYDDIPSHPGRIDINGDHRNDRPLTAAEREAKEREQRQLEALGYIGGADPADEADDEDRSFLDRSGDMMHTNSVAYLPEHDLIALSVPEYNEVWVIDHSTTTAEAATDRGGRFGRGGEILWRWGNPRQYGAGGDDDRVLGYQHDATWIATDDDLRLLLFNNRATGADEPRSEVLELVLPFDPESGFARADGEAHGPASAVWSYSAPGDFYSAFISGAQRLPNGNTLICSGAPGRLFEVTRGGDIVWDYFTPLGGDIKPPDHAGKAPANSLFRGTRLRWEHPGIKALLGER